LFNLRNTTSTEDINFDLLPDKPDDILNSLTEATVATEGLLSNQTPLRIQWIPGKEGTGRTGSPYKDTIQGIPIDWEAWENAPKDRKNFYYVNPEQRDEVINRQWKNYFKNPTSLGLSKNATVEDAIKQFDHENPINKINILKEQGIDIKNKLKDFDMSMLNPFKMKEAYADEITPSKTDDSGIDFGLLPDKFGDSQEKETNPYGIDFDSLPDKTPEQTVIRAGKTDSLISRVGTRIGQTLGLVKTPEERQAEAQNMYALSEVANIPLSDVRENWAKIKNLPQVTGIQRTDPTLMELASVPIGLGVLWGTITNPIQTALGVGGFLALSEVENFVVSKIKEKPYLLGADMGAKELLPEESTQASKDFVDILDFIAKGAVLGAVNKKLPALGQKLTKNIIEKYNLPKKVFISAKKVQAIFNPARGKITPAEESLVRDLGLSGDQYKIAINKGLNIEIPAEKITTITDKPYWAKIKGLFKVKPETQVKVSRLAKPTTIKGALPSPEQVGKLKTVKPVVKEKPIETIEQIETVIKTPIVKEPLIAEAKGKTLGEFVKAQELKSAREEDVFVRPEFYNKGKAGFSQVVEKSSKDRPLLDKNERAVVYRDKQGNPQGAVSFKVDEKGKLLTEEELGAGVEVYVNPKLRRQGIATKLYDQAKKLGFDLDKVEGRAYTKEGKALRESQLTDIWKKAQEKGGVTAMVASKGAEEGGYGTIESSEKATKPKIAKTDYAKIESVLPPKTGVLDEILKLTSPAERKGALIAKKILRKNIAELAHKDVMAAETLKKAHKAFTWMNEKDSLAFIDKVETGQWQVNKKLQVFSEQMRKLLDSRRADVQNLGKGHLESFLVNYFPHIWEDPIKAKNVISSIMGKKKLEGTKSFLKKRTIISVKEGVDKGLKLVSSNPIDLVLLKIHEMDRYVMAQNIIRDLKERELIKFVYVKGQKLDGYTQINDNAFTVYLPPEITKKEAFDSVLVDQMMDVARSLDIDTKRFVGLGGPAWGYAYHPPGEKVRTRFASPESVLAHEIGHILGFRYDLYNLLGRRRDGEWKVHKFGKNIGQKYFEPTKEAVEYRRKIDKQWRDLADARKARQSYARKSVEKEAVLLESLIHAPNEFQRVAPDLFKVFKSFLNNHSELRPLLDIKPSLVLGESEAKIKIPGFTTLGHYYAPEPVGSLLNNYLSPGLRNNKNKLVSGGYNIARGLGNVLNQAQLSLSLFHGLNVTSDMAISTFGLGLRKLNIKGQRLKGLTDIVTAPVAPIINVWNGSRIRKAYTQQMDSITDPKLKEMVEAVVAAGGRDRMDVFYYNNQIKALEKTFSDIWKGGIIDKIKGSARLPFNLFGATLESLAKPLMEWYVPTGKIGLFSKLAQHEMERAEVGQIDEDQLWERLTQSWDSIDNRMGQLIYDNLFWEKNIKDSLMLAIRSVGWNLGSWREFGGSAVDLITTKERINRGDIWFSHKMAYTISAVVIYSILGAIIQYVLTGKPPEEPKDYLFPKTGKNNPDGSPERLSLPTYAKDWYAWSHQPLKTLTHKLHPLWGMLGDLATNKDYFNVEIRHADDPLENQLMQVLKHIGNNFKSISIRNYEKMERTTPENKLRNAVVSITGITSAPAYITRSPAQKLMTRLIIERIPPKSKTKEEFEKSTYRKTLKNRIRKGEKIDRKEAYQILGFASYNRLIKEAKLPPFADSFNRLSIVDALNVYAIATPEEKKQVKKILKRKFIRANEYTKTKEVKDFYNTLIK